MLNKLPKFDAKNIKAETVLKGVSILLTVGGAIVTNKLTSLQQEAERGKMKEEILKEIFEQQNS